MGSYVSSTREQQEEMLVKIGCAKLEDLFASLPSDVMLKKELDLPLGLSEMEVSKKMREMSDKNVVFKNTYRGAGAYKHYIPSIVKNIVSKEEFLTAYTPYQPEISQGILQAIFEYQTIICELTGMDVANASVYDGASAAAEAVGMCKDRKRNKALISSLVNPQVIETIKTYCYAYGIEFELIPAIEGVTDKEALSNMIDDATACVYLQQPNYLGIIEDASEISQITHLMKAKFIMGVNPISTMILKTPSECGADIAVGDGQPLGMPLSYGGPYLGFMATKSDMIRNLPGRIVGETVDKDLKRAFVLTLQAREQHIRREKASSNICSNQALCALTASAFVATIGPVGMQRMASLCTSKAHYLSQELSKLGFFAKYPKEFFHEFLSVSPVKPEGLCEYLESKGILGGLIVDEDILWCTTEMNSKEDIDVLIAYINDYLSKARTQPDLCKGGC